MGKIEIGPAAKEIILPVLKQKRDELDQLITELESGEERAAVTTRKKTRGPGRPKKQATVQAAEGTGKKCYTSTIQAILRKANHPMDAKDIFHELQKGGYATTFKQLEAILDKCVEESLVTLKGGHYQLPQDQD